MISHILNWAKVNIISKKFRNKDLDIDILITKNSIDKILHYLHLPNINYLQKLMLVSILSNLPSILQDAKYIAKDELPHRAKQRINIKAVKNLVIVYKIENTEYLLRLVFWSMSNGDNLLKTITFNDVFLNDKEFNVLVGVKNSPKHISVARLEYVLVGYLDELMGTNIMKKFNTSQGL